MPARTSVPPGRNRLTIRRRSAISSVEIKFAQIKSYCRAGRIGSLATSPRADPQLFCGRHLRGRWRGPRARLRGQNQRHGPAHNPAWPRQWPGFPSRCRCLKMTGRVPIFATPHQFPQAKCRRRMLAGAETQAGIQHHHRLIFAGPPFAPARFDEQSIADFDGFEMPFPRFGPVFAAHFRQRDLAGAGFQPAMIDLFQAGEQISADLLRRSRFLLADKPRPCSGRFPG